MRGYPWLMSGITLMATFSACASDTCSAQSGDSVVPLVELYTSEGCSSCPPADRWLSRRLALHDANFLAFHVDYWDGLGWPDRFADPSYSLRQQRRVAAAGASTVYTPQVMLGELIQAPWRSDAAFAEAINRQRKPASVAQSLALESNASGTRIVFEARRTYSAPALNVQLWVAHYIDGQITPVRGGENDGITLHHDRVVRQLWGPWTLGESPFSHVITAVPAIENGGLVAFAEDADGRILQSLDLSPANCNELNE